MRLYTILRLTFAGFLLYVAWPFIPVGTTPIAKGFWITWLTFLCFVIGGNLATLLQLTNPPVMEQEQEKRETARMH